MILDEFESNDTKEAFINGDFYIKVHGECGWISPSGDAYRRNQTPKVGFRLFDLIGLESYLMYIDLKT